jgi:uncharacterized protein YodC (DUF2158 family)
MKRLFLAAAFLALLLSPASAQNIGDVVFLKSGGPPMTVTEILPGGGVGLHWFSGALMMAGTFPAISLVVTDPSPVLTKAQADERCRIFPPKEIGGAC